jgi:hypothetical protein
MAGLPDLPLELPRERSEREDLLAGVHVGEEGRSLCPEGLQAAVAPGPQREPDRLRSKTTDRIISALRHLLFTVPSPRINYREVTSLSIAKTEPLRFPLSTTRIRGADLIPHPTP